MTSEQPMVTGMSVSRFVGGMRYGGTSWPFPGKGDLSWPLAALEIDESRVRISPRGWLRSRVLPAVEIPLDQITSVETRFGVRRAGLRFRSLGEGDKTVFWPLPRQGALIEAALRNEGVTVG
jgi:hypothetical protein